MLLFICLGPWTSVLAQFETRATLSLSAYAPSPVAAAVGDFNRDGKLDLAITDQYNGQVVILLGNGDGTFHKGTSYAVGEEEYAIGVADFRKNGLLDLAVGSQIDSSIYVLLGNGDGTFQNAVPYPAVGYGVGLTVGDFTGDGEVDIAALTYAQTCDCVSVYPGNGDGTFRPAVTTALLSGLAPFALSSGRFIRDGKMDLVAAGSIGSSGTLEILLGNGDGTFSFDGSYDVSYSPQSVAIADLNGDKKVDMAVANYGSGYISILLGNGDGTFQQAENYFSGSFAPTWVVTSDLDGNGIPDLAVSDYSSASGVSTLKGNGDGTFQSAVFYPAGRGIAYVAVNDFNGDRQPDLVLLDYTDGALITLLNTGAVSFSPTTPLNFKKVKVGTTSAPQTLTLTNTGKSALTISSMKTTGQFAETNTCGSSVAAAANCSISVTFSPKSTGAKFGTVTINDSASSKPQVIELSGTGD